MRHNLKFTMPSSISHHFLFLLASSLHFRQATSLPLRPVITDMPHPRLLIRSSSPSSSTFGTNRGIDIMVGITMGVFLSSILAYMINRYCAINRAFKKEEAKHSPRCNEEYRQARVARLNRHRVIRESALERVCSCQGLVEGDSRNAMPPTEEIEQYHGEVAGAAFTAQSMDKRLDSRQVNEWNGQGRAGATEREADNVGGIDAAPPPYSLVDGVIERLTEPEPARIRGARIVGGPNGNAVVWREG